MMDRTRTRIVNAVDQDNNVVELLLHDGELLGLVWYYEGSVYSASRNDNATSYTDLTLYIDNENNLTILMPNHEPSMGDSNVLTVYDGNVKGANVAYCMKWLQSTTKLTQ